MKNVSKRMKNKGHVKRLVIFDYDFVGKSQICGLEKLTSRESYAILVKANTVKSTARNYFENLFEKSDFIWKKKLFGYNHIRYNNANVPV